MVGTPASTCCFLAFNKDSHLSGRCSDDHMQKAATPRLGLRNLQGQCRKSKSEKCFRESPCSRKKKELLSESPQLMANGNLKRLWPYHLLARKVKLKHIRFSTTGNSQHTWTVTLAVLVKRSLQLFITEALVKEFFMSAFISIIHLGSTKLFDTLLLSCSLYLTSSNLTKFYIINSICIYIFKYNYLVIHTTFLFQNLRYFKISRFITFITYLGIIIYI